MRAAAMRDEETRREEIGEQSKALSPRNSTPPGNPVSDSSLIPPPSSLRRRRRQSAVCTAFEDEARAQGFQFIAGVDEVGRGALAGPVVAAAVILDSEKPL